ncbi:MAG: hypothetical protein ACUVTM_08170 [Candidatus Bathyarchaeia archaeon]
MFDISRLDVSNRSDRALIKEYALRGGVWMFLPRVERRLFDLTLHPTVKRWWGKVRWRLALDLLRRVVQKLRLAIYLLRSRYFRRCYKAVQSLVDGALKDFESVKGRVNLEFQREYLKDLREATVNPDLIMYIGTKFLNEVPGQGLKLGLGRVYG